MAKDFGISMQESIDRMITRMDRVRKVFTTSIFEKVIERTPVHEYHADQTDKGRARTSWYTYIGGPAAAPATSVHMQVEDVTKSAMRGVVESSQIDDTVGLVNNTFYILTLENGGYPRPEARLGTYVPWLDTYIKLSKGGYSLQAPQGMVKITMTEAGHMWSQANKAVQ